MAQNGSQPGPGASSQPASNDPNAVSPAAASPTGPGSRPTVDAGVAVRRERYMIASRQLPGVQPMAADVLANSLTSLPDVTIVRRIRPRGLGALAAGGPTGAAPEIVVAEMDPARGAALRATAPPNIVVERDALLRHADVLATADFNNIALGVGIDIQLRVVGAGGRPLPKATVYVYGLGFPAQGVTNDRGETTITFFGGTIDTVQAIYVKPVADHWDRMIQSPALQANGMNTLQLRPLSDTFRGFPEAGMVGWGQQLMKLDRLDPSYTGEGVKIAIVDSGCDNTHPQLGHVTRGVDLTNNGDRISWVKDVMGHGTHCAGVITAAADRLKGIRGFAPKAEVHSLKVFPGGRFSDLIDALDQCIEREVDIVNLSLGSGDVSELVAQKLVEARQRGIACVVAAGNTGGPVQFPGSQPSVLTVSAIGKLDEFPPDSYHAQTVAPELVAGTMFAPKFSCFGPQIAVAAPGVAIVSTVPGGGYAAWDGTSMAAPHVTGMGALLLAHHPLLHSSARNEQRVAQLFALLASSGVRYLGSSVREGAGVLDLQRVPGLAAGAQPAGVATAASAPPPAIAPAGVAAPWLFANPPFFVPTPGAAQAGGQVGGLSPFSSANVQQLGPAINPALYQNLLQLHAAGLI